jgi:hypothetical protein
VNEYQMIRKAADEHRAQLDQLRKNLASYIETEGRPLFNIIVRVLDADGWLEQYPPAERKVRRQAHVDMQMQWLIDNADEVTQALKPFITNPTEKD